MPEILEVETARAFVESRALHRTITAVDAPDSWIIKGGATPDALVDALTGRPFASVRRRGKQLYLDADGPVLGVHLGMSGRLVVDDDAAGDPLVYGANGENPAWLRFGVTFADGGAFWLRDPRRLGRIELDPDEERLGPDALTLSARELTTALDRRRAPLKAVLMDQRRIAGLGNLLVDEILWRAAIRADRPAGDLDADDRRRLLRSIRSTLRVLGRRGGSHTGDLPREPDAVCPRDGTPLRRETVAGRTTWWCPLHQRG